MNKKLRDDKDEAEIRRVNILYYPCCIPELSPFVARCVF